MDFQSYLQRQSFLVAWIWEAHNWISCIMQWKPKRNSIQMSFNRSGGSPTKPGPKEKRVRSSSCHSCAESHRGVDVTPPLNRCAPGILVLLHCPLDHRGACGGLLLLRPLPLDHFKNLGEGEQSVTGTPTPILINPNELYSADLCYPGRLAECYNWGSLGWVCWLAHRTYYRGSWESAVWVESAFLTTTPPFSQRVTVVIFTLTGGLPQ